MPPLHDPPAALLQGAAARVSGDAMPGAFEEAAAASRALRAALRRIAALVARTGILEEEVRRLQAANVRASRLAYLDELTGLPNRNLLQDRFTQALALAARHGRQVALVFVDLDGFKRVNDVLGHTAGDLLLQLVAARLAGCLRASDTACRYGGDEFVVLLPDLEDAPSALAVAAKVRADLASVYCVDGRAVEVTASVGIALYPGDGAECTALIRAADRAMYRNKARDRTARESDRERGLPRLHATDAPAPRPADAGSDLVAR